MKIKLFVLAAIMTALFITGSLFSQEYQGRNRNDEVGKRDRIKEKLNLTEEQIDKIEDLKLSHRKEIIDLRAEVEKKEVELEELKSNHNFSREAYLSKTNEIISAKNKLEIARANHQMDVYQLLDENQKKEWNKMTRMMHDRKHKEVREIRENNLK